MNTNVETVEVNEVVTGDEVAAKVPKLTKTMLAFKSWMEFHYPDRVLNYTRPVAAFPLFEDPETDMLYKIYSAGMTHKKYLYPDIFIIGKVTEDAEVQFSARPRVVEGLDAAIRNRKYLEKKHGCRFTTFAIHEADYSYLNEKGAVVDSDVINRHTEKPYRALKVVFRHNSQAK